MIPRITIVIPLKRLVGFAKVVRDIYVIHLVVDVGPMLFHEVLWVQR